MLALKEKGMNQKTIARLLNITEPAVSQYLKNKRGNGIIFNDEVKTFVKNSLPKITDNHSAYRQIQEINSFIKESKALCKIHMDIESGLQSCDVCYR